MSTYLEICQKVAQRSGTVPTLGEPSTVSGVSGRLQRITGWVSEAWEDIQSASEDWLWMSTEFTGQTISGIASYNAAAMGISDRFRSWVQRCEEGDDLFSIYLTSTGKSDEGKLNVRDWEWMRRNAFIGTWETDTSKPGYITIDPANNLVLYPVPDAVYTIRGRYVKAPQILSADGDTPEMPSTFHDAIVYKALTLLAEFDEDDRSYGRYYRSYLSKLDSLCSGQLPKIRCGGPLA